MTLENAIIRDGKVYKVIFADKGNYEEYMDCQHCDMAKIYGSDDCVGCDLFGNVARYTLIGVSSSFIVEDLKAHAFKKKLVGQTFNIETKEDSCQDEIKFVEEIGKSHFRIVTLDKTEQRFLAHYFPEEDMNKLCAGETIVAQYATADNDIRKCSVSIIFNKTNES